VNSKSDRLDFHSASLFLRGKRLSGSVTLTTVTSKVRALPASSWLASMVTSLSVIAVTVATAPLESCTFCPTSRPSGAASMGTVITASSVCSPYASAGSMRTLRSSPAARPVTAMSKPLMTWPPPTRNWRGARPSEESKTVPSSRVPL